jgi:fumarate reductase flavoprotein subunit
MAALVGARVGARVLVLEKTPNHGGGTALSHRALRAAGSRVQRMAGIEDSPDNYAREILQRSQCREDEPLVRALTEVSGRMIEFLADVAKVDFYLDEFTFGQTASRSHKWRSGGAITDHLFAAVSEHEAIEVRFDTPVRSLVAEGETVVGVRTAHEAIAAHKVLLASGGFGANSRLIERYIPQATGVELPGHAGSTGEAIEMAGPLGASLRHMDSFQPYPAHVGPGKRGVPPGVILSGGVVVDANGSRFVDESLYPGGLAGAILALPDKRAFEVFDQRIFDEHRDMSGDRSIMQMSDDGVLISAETAEDLALGFGLDPAGLKATLAEHAATVGGMDRYGRRIDHPLVPPLYGIAVRVALYHTQGGLAVDRHGRVLRDDETVVPNLYAGGGAASGISGDGMDGYLPGNGLLASLGLGMIAAEHAVLSIRQAGHTA